MRSCESELRRRIANWIELCDADAVFRIREDAFVDGDNCLANERQVDCGPGYLSYGLPHAPFSPVLGAGERMFWFPNNLPEGSSALVASSRIGNKPDQKPEIFDAIRTLVCRIEPGSQFLITHETMATHQVVSRATELFGIPIVEFRPFPNELDADWFEHVCNEADRFVCYYDRKQDEWEGDFQLDQFMISLANEVRLLEVRKGGNVLKASRRCLGKISQAPIGKTLYLLTHRRLNSAEVNKTLTEQGALPWYLYRSDDEKPAASGKHAPDGRSHAAIQRTCSFVTLEQFRQNHQLEDYVVHWTRRRKGPWPNQSENRYLDDLLFGTDAANHDRLHALLRILATNKLLATSQLTRDSRPVVCFSAVTVDQLGSLRQFRRHLGRWDFETAGIAVKRSVFEAAGGRKAIYGDEADWSSLPASDRPFFQKRQSGTIDWSVEQEWRVVGDFDLARIGTDDAFVFVDNDDDARQVAELCNWAVVTID